MDRFDWMTLAGWALLMAGLFLIDPLLFGIGAGFSLMAVGLAGAYLTGGRRRQGRGNDGK